MKIGIPKFFGRILVLALIALGTMGITPVRVGIFELVDDVTPGGARCRLAVPKTWNGQLLIIAHGYIPAGRPLYAGFDPGDPVYRELLADGWLVAATSYRRNGFLFREAAADVEELRALVARRQGRAPDAVFVEGTSMGGFVATLLAEDPPHPSYRGALGLGAALDIQAPGVELPGAHRSAPLPPLVFVQPRRGGRPAGLRAPCRGRHRFSPARRVDRHAGWARQPQPPGGFRRVRRAPGRGGKRGRRWNPTATARYPRRPCRKPSPSPRTTGRPPGKSSPWTRRSGT